MPSIRSNDHAPRSVRFALARLIGALSLLAALLLPATIDAGTYSYALSVSDSASRSSAVRLDGATVSGTRYVFLSSSATITSVSFWLDDPDRTKPALHTERYAPFDYAGTASDGTAYGWPTSHVADGEHSITVEVAIAGRPMSSTATFVVANAVPTPTPTPTATPTPTPPKHSITVANVPALLKALADDSLDEIVVADGTYHVSPASLRHADSLWIGSAFAGRTRPIVVRAATRGGVTFDGGDASQFGCLSFEQGAHDQTWDGFSCAGGSADRTGVVTFGGYPGYAAPHHITLSHVTIAASCTGSATSASSPATDHAFYISEAVGGPHDLLFSDITVEGAGGLASAFHFYHSDAGNRNGWNITVRRLHVTHTQQGIMLWDATLHDITFDSVDITGALRYGVRYELGSAITLRNVTTAGSGSAGFYSSQGATPPGVTFSGDSFR